MDSILFPSYCILRLGYLYILISYGFLSYGNEIVLIGFDGGSKEVFGPVAASSVFSFLCGSLLSLLIGCWCNFSRVGIPSAVNYWWIGCCSNRCF